MPDDLMSESGRGLPIIRRLVDSVEHYRRSRINTTVYRFKLSAVESEVSQ